MDNKLLFAEKLQQVLAEHLTVDEVKALIEQRNIARANKNWAEADRIRDLLNAQGIKINDKKIG